MASRSQKIKKSPESKEKRSRRAFILDSSWQRLRNLGIGLGGALIMLAAPASITADTLGFAQRQEGKTTIFDQSATRVFNKVPSYNIGRDETHLYNQPDRSSIFVQRVIGGESSRILGQLAANGQVWIMNPGGVLIGSQATVNTAGFLASTLVMDEKDFFAGRYLLKQDGKGGFVINQGAINTKDGGYAILAGSSVTNGGYIQANLGQVVLAAGSAMTMDFTGDQLIKFAVDEKTAAKIAGPDGKDLSSAVRNEGLIKADGGRVLLTAKAAARVMDSVVNNTGVIRAQAAWEKNGEIILAGGDEGAIVNSGTLDASGKAADRTGGTVQVLGEYVGLFGQAVIDASGSAGGGTILLGGNFRGQGREANARQTYVGPAVQIKADAVNQGDGGQVVAWSDDATGFFGNISARGGSVSGNGGFVEVSGKGYLDFRGLVNTSAPMGQNGTLLLDPTEISIRHGANGGNTAVTISGAGPFADTSSGAGSILTDGTINAQLGANNVTVTTAVNGIAIENTAGAVVITPAGGANAGTLTLSSGANILWNAGWSYSNNGQLTLQAKNGTISGSGAIALGGASPFLLQATAGIGMAGAPVLTTGLTSLAAATGTGGIFINDRGSGNVSINSLNNSATGDVNGLSAPLGDIQLRNLTGDITVNQTVAASGNVTLGAAGNITDSGFTIAADSLALEAGGAQVTLTDAQVNTLAVFAPAAAVNITTAAPLGTLSVGTVGATDGIAADSLVLTEMSGDISIDQVVDTTTTATISAAGNITDSGFTVAADGLELIAGGAQVTLTDAHVNILAVFAPAAAVDITATAPLGTLSVGTVGLTSGITADSLIITETSGDISFDQAVATITTATISAAGNITDSGFTVAADGLELIAGGAAVTLTDAQVNTLAVFAPVAVVDITTTAPLGALTVGTVGLTSGITADSLALTETLGNISIGQPVAVTTTASLAAASGSLTANGALTVAGATSLTAGTGKDITLDSVANDLGGPVNVVSSRNVTLADKNNIIIGDINAAQSANLTAARSILNDGVVGTRLAATVANLAATTGTIGLVNVPVEVDVSDVLNVLAGGAQDGWLSANLQGRSITALNVDPRTPGLVMFNNALPGTPLTDGGIIILNKSIGLGYLEGIAQNTARLANEAEDYALTLDTYSNDIFAPYTGLFRVVGTGVAPQRDE